MLQLLCPPVLTRGMIKIAAVLEGLGESADVIKKADAEAAAMHALCDDPPEGGIGLTCRSCLGWTQTTKKKANRILSTGKVGQQPPKASGDDEAESSSNASATTSSIRNAAPVIKSRFPREPLVVLMGDFNTDAYADDEEKELKAGERKDESAPLSKDGVPSSARRVSSLASVETSWTNSTADHIGECSLSGEAPGSLAVPRVVAWRQGCLASAYPLAKSLAACVDCQWDLRRGGSWSTWKLRGSYEARHQIDYIFVSQAQGNDSSSSSSSSSHHKTGNKRQEPKKSDALSRRNSRVVQVLAPPSAVPPSRLPCAAYPSDHLCIAADIAFD